MFAQLLAKMDGFDKELAGLLSYWRKMGGFYKYSFPQTLGTQKSVTTNHYHVTPNHLKHAPNLSLGVTFWKSHSKTCVWE